MTIIIGLEYEGEVYIGGDSIAVAGFTKSVIASRKVFRVDGFLIGYTSSFRMGQLLQYQLAVRQQQEGESDERYMVVDFTEAVRELFKAHGFAEVNNNVEHGGNFIVGYRGKVYEVCSDFQVNRYANGIAATGCGQDYALGAMLALDGGVAPINRILRALDVTEQLCTSVSAPFYVEKL